eukprot:gene33814-41713_t
MTQLELSVPHGASLLNTIYTEREFASLDNTKYLRELLSKTTDRITTLAGISLLEYEMHERHLETIRTRAFYDTTKAGSGVNTSSSSRPTVSTGANITPGTNTRSSPLSSSQSGFASNHFAHYNHWIDQDGQVSSEVKQFAAQVMQTFSTDHYNSTNTSEQMLLADDVLDFLTAFDCAVSEVQREKIIDSIATTDKDNTSALKQFDLTDSTSPLKYFGRINSAAMKVLFCGSDASLSESSATDNLTAFLQEEQRKQVITQMCSRVDSEGKVTTNGLNLAVLEDLCVLLLFKANKYNNVKDILSKITYWETASNEQVLDLIDDYYSSHLDFQTQQMAVYKPHIDLKYEQMLCGRRMTPVEFHARMRALSETMRTATHRRAVHYFQSQHGLTVSPISTLKADWLAFYKGPLYKKRWSEVAHKDSKGNLLRGGRLAARPHTDTHLPTCEQP